MSGSHNTLDNLRMYRNGNTGLQISRYKSNDLWEDWPSYNLILNCTSYLNADPGYEDADGFAAKLTIADGNVFDGCIAAYNADDGWDLFAKIESGPIGRVEIRNCVAFKNGYDISEDGQEIVAGNGNGFKMGGSSITGYHTLRNSVAFANRSKGIDSNSCPDIQVYNSISFNNESYNVAFYTNDAKNTDFFADGIISYRTPDAEKSYNTGEQFKFLGSQDESKVKGKTNYYWSAGKSTNTDKVAVADDWFVNLDMAAAINGGIHRNADGTINMNGFLVLTDKAPADAGARLEGKGTSSEAIVMPELVKDEDSNDGGNGGNGGNGGAAGFVADTNWDTVASNIDTAAKSGSQQNVDVQSGDSFEVPANVLSKLVGKNVTLALHAGDSITFSITGNNIKKVNASFKMNVSHADVIPANAAKQVLANALVSKAFSMADKSVYPFPVNVHANLGAENAGKMAYLYYYDEASKSMKLAGSFRITANGQAMFAIYRGDEYIITVANGPAVLSGNSGNYVVVKNDTLSIIASKTGVTLKRLVEANPQIQNIHKIFPGQQINIP